MAKLITGYSGGKHITPSDDAAVHKSIFGRAAALTELRVEVTSAGELTIYPAVIEINGRIINIEKAEKLTVDFRQISDVVKTVNVVAKYNKDSNGVETVTLGLNYTSAPMSNSADGFGASNNSEYMLAYGTATKTNVTGLTNRMKMYNSMPLRGSYKEDLDIITAPGFYSLKNCPNGPRGNSWGALIVVKADLSTSDELTDTIQVYVDSKNTIFTRHSIDKNSWTDWEFVFPDISTETKNAFKAIGWRE